MEPTTTTQLIPPVPPLFDEARLAIGGFLARYSGSTRSGYACDLRAWFARCAQGNLDVFGVRRVHIELYARWMEEDRHLARATIGRRLSTVVGFYRFAVVDGYMAESPAQQRPSSEDRHRVDDPRPRPHGARGVPGPGGGRRARGSRSGLSPGPAGPTGLGGVRHGHRAPRNRAGTPHRHRHRQRRQGGRDPAAASGCPVSGPGCRRAPRWSSSAIPIRRAPRSSWRYPHRSARGPTGRHHQAHLPPLVEAQLHHGCPRRWGASP